MSGRHDRTISAARKAGGNAARRHARGEHVQAPDPLAGSLLARKAATAWHAGFAEATSHTDMPEVKAVSGPDLSPRSGMISLDLPAGSVDPVPGGMDDGTHHVTIVYLGPDVDDDAYEAACQRAAAAAAAVPGPLQATLAGIGTFPPSDGSDGKTPVFIPASIPGGDHLRNGLADLSASEHREWHPHVTLAYAGAGDALPPEQPRRQVTFTHLAVHRGDDVRRFPLGPATITKGANGMHGTLEHKVGPRGYTHGWRFVGVPGVGHEVHHPSHGKGIVTEVTGKHVTVKFHGSGATRTYEHATPKPGGKTGFVKRSEHEAVDAAHGTKPEATAPGKPAETRLSGHAETARRLAADVRSSPVRSTLIGGRHYDTREMAATHLAAAAAHFGAGRNSEALNETGHARRVLADRASEGRSAVQGDAGRLRLADRSADPTSETAMAFRDESAGHAGRAEALHRAAAGSPTAQAAQTAPRMLGQSAGNGHLAVHAAAARQLGAAIRGTESDVPTRHASAGRGSLASGVLEHAASRFDAGDETEGVRALNAASHAIGAHAYESGKVSREARDKATRMQGRNGDIELAQRAGRLEAVHNAALQHAERANTLYDNARVGYQFRDANGAPAKPGDEAELLHDTEIGHTPGGTRGIISEVHGTQATLRPHNGGPSVITGPDGIRLTSTADRERAIAKAKNTHGQLSEEERATHPALGVISTEKRANGSTLTHAVDHQGRDFHLELGGNGQVTVTHQGRSKSALRGGDATTTARRLAGELTAGPAAPSGSTGHAATARAIAGDVRLERGLSPFRREEAEKRLYAAARHLDDGNHDEAAAELNEASHVAGTPGGGVIKGTVAARARALHDEIRPAGSGQPEAGDFWADQDGHPEPAPAAPAPKPKWDQGGMFADPDRLGTAPMFGDKFGTSGVTSPNPDAIAPPAAAAPAKWEHSVTLTGGSYFSHVNGHGINVSHGRDSIRGYTASVGTQQLGTHAHLPDAQREAEEHARSLPAGAPRRNAAAGPTANQQHSAELGKLIGKVGREADTQDTDAMWKAHDALLEARRHLDEDRPGHAVAALNDLAIAPSAHSTAIRDLRARIQMTSAHGPQEADTTPWLGSLRAGDNAEYRKMNGHTIAITPRPGPGGGYQAHIDGTLLANNDDLNKIRRTAERVAGKTREAKNLAAEGITALAGALASRTGREDAVRHHLGDAVKSLQAGDPQAAYGALDMARRHAAGELGGRPSAAHLMVLLDDGTEAHRPILRWRDTVRREP